MAQDREGRRGIQAKQVIPEAGASKPRHSIFAVSVEFAEFERQALAAATTEGVVVLNSDGVMIRLNSRAKSMLGLSDDHLGGLVREVLGHALFAGTDGVPLPVERWPGLRALQGETLRDQEIGVHRDGRTIWLRTCALPIAGGGAVVTLSDVTSHHNLEQHHDQMLRLVSHDIRNPLTSVHLNAQLLEKALVDRALEKEQRLAASVIGAARRLDAMIQELVDSSRVRSGQLGLILRPVSIEHFIPEILARNASSIDTARIRLVLPTAPVLAKADVSRLERVLINLLVIAVQHSSDEAETVLRVERADDELHFSIEAPGRSSARDEVLPLPTSHFGHGKREMDFGIGLFISRMLIERHGGRLWVEVTANRGTTFHFAIPLDGDRVPPSPIE